jgi:hypothetical protein
MASQERAITAQRTIHHADLAALLREIAGRDDLAAARTGQPRQLTLSRLGKLYVDAVLCALTKLEEAVLISLAGCTGLTMPDPSPTPGNGTPILATPNLTMAGRTAGTPITTRCVVLLDHRPLLSAQSCR